MKRKTRLPPDNKLPRQQEQASDDDEKTKETDQVLAPETAIGSGTNGTLHQQQTVDVVTVTKNFATATASTAAKAKKAVKKGTDASTDVFVPLNNNNSFFRTNRLDA